jgi:hypothetical protein
MVRLVRDDGAPVTGASLHLRADSLVIPRQVLEIHQGLLHLPSRTDGSGRLLLAGLAPGHYDLFLAEGSSPASIRAGALSGYLTSVNPGPFATLEIEATLAEP